MDSGRQQHKSAQRNSAYRIAIWLLALGGALQVVFVCQGILKRSFHEKLEREKWEASMEKKFSLNKDSLENFPPISTPDLAKSHPDLVPRSVEDILRTEINDDTSPRRTPRHSSNNPPAIGKKPQNLTNSPTSTGNQALDKLIFEARSAMIAGDMRNSVLKLEEAQRIAPENPAVLFYLAQTFETLRNYPKAREYYLKVFQLREAAGNYFKQAERKIELGFNDAANIRGQMAFGNIQEFKDPEQTTGERVVLTIPIMVKPGVTINPDDVYIPVQFYDILNNKTIALTRAEEPTFRWTSEPVDWADGEETLEVRYYLPPLTNNEILAFGDLRYYGYTAKLYYKGEPMDYQGNPKALVLQELKMRQGNDPDVVDPNEGLLPPIEAEPMSNTLKSNE